MPTKRKAPAAPEPPKKPYADEWPRVRGGRGKWVVVRALKNPPCVLNTISRLRVNGQVPRGIELARQGNEMVARAVRPKRAAASRR